MPGAAESASARVEAGRTTIRLALARSTRACGTCTACCDGWLPGTVRGHDMKPGVPCHFRGAGCCAIYAERPESPCRQFFCGWVWPDSPLPDTFRPDRLGVIFVPRRWRGRGFFAVVAAGREPDDALIAFMLDFHHRSATPFAFVRNGLGHAIGPPEFQEAMRAKVARGEPMF
jgi:hypothetical protein